MTVTDTAPSRYRVAALYRFAKLADHAALKTPLAELCCAWGIRGTLLLATEGVNGTVAGTPDAIADLVAWLKDIPGLADLDVKYSDASEMPFHRMKVRLKKEIVTMGVEGVDPLTDAGAYVEPDEWNALIADPGTIIVDTRNDYEVALGTFKGAVDPRTNSFAEFPGWARDNAETLKGRKVAMFCTGGIRCEKATAYMRSLGLEDVYHLRGGILRYLEQVKPEDSLWEGECFVFDERVSVVHGLDEGEAELCRACRRPLTPQDRLSPLYAEGVSCPHCHEARSDRDRARYAERQHQVKLAAKRGRGPHIGR